MLKNILYLVIINTSRIMKMGRVLVTGDTHRYLDIRKLNTTKFSKQKNLTKDDDHILIIMKN